MFRKFGIFLILVGLTVPQTVVKGCPPANQLAPCECVEDSDNSIWTCNGDAHPDIDLKAVFDRVSPLIGENVIFSKLYITDNSNTQLPADTMTSLKFKHIALENNGFQFIHPDAFNATYDVTTYLSLEDNKLSNGKNNSRDNFEFVGRFKNLETLSMMGNSLKVIPSKPFGDALHNLQSLNAGQCNNGGLDHVGSRILSNLPNLKMAKFRECNLTEQKFARDSFEGIGPSVILNLQYNPINSLPEAVFKPVLEHAAGLIVGGREWCPDGERCFRRLDCDQRSDWLCGNQTSYYEQKLNEFLCWEPEGWDIWKWCRENAGQ